jgi:hypothetical protein
VSVVCCPLSGRGDADGYTEAHTSTVRRARKEHRCAECRETIPAGARYEYQSGIWEGDPFSHKTCLSCVEIRDHFACDGYIYGELWNDLEQNFFPDMKAGGPCMEGLSPAAKGRLFERRLKWLEDSA